MPMSAFDCAVVIIDCWYRAGERDIAVSPQVFANYKGGLQFCGSWVEGLVTTPRLTRRLAYKTSIVYVAEGWY